MKIAIASVKIILNVIIALICKITIGKLVNKTNGYRMFALQCPMKLLDTFVAKKQFTMEGIDVYHINDDFLPRVIFFAKMPYTNEVIIVKNNCYDNFLTETEKQVCLNHELGHFKLGHYEMINSGWLIDMNAEFAADEYSATVVGKEAVKKSLTKLQSSFHANFGEEAIKEENDMAFFNQRINHISNI